MNDSCIWEDWLSQVKKELGITEEAAEKVDTVALCNEIKEYYEDNKEEIAQNAHRVEMYEDFFEICKKMEELEQAHVAKVNHP
jgi:gluconate kinase